MICNDTDGHVILVFFSIFFFRKPAHVVSQCFDRIYVKNRIHILYNTCQTLQAHSCINIFLLQFRIVTLPVVIELGEHIVPDLHIPVAVASYRTVRFTAAVSLASVIIYFRTRTAGA